MKVKLCGFRDCESLKIAIEKKCDFLGFVFVDKSPRNISVMQARALSDLVPNSIKKVAVVVNSNLEFISQIITNFNPDFLQFHGDEDVEFLKKFRQKFPQVKIIKAFRINEVKDLEGVRAFEDYCDLFLFDGQNPGSGKKFNWEILKNFNCKKDWFLSGGINLDNLDEVLKIKGLELISLQELKKLKALNRRN